MKKQDIKVGGHYLAKVNGRVVEVKVDRIEERSDSRGRTTTTYHVTSLKTGRRTTFRSAQKFQGLVGQRATIKGSPGEDALPAADDAGSVQTFDQVHGEAEQRPDPTDAPTETTPPPSSPAAAAAPAADPEPSANGSTPLSRLLRSALKQRTGKLDMVPTPEQQAIIDLALTLGKGDVLVIEAGAGTGKTSTDLMLEQLLPGIGQYTCFSRPLCDKVKTKFKFASVRTQHSLAYQAEGKRFAHRLDSPKMRSADIARLLGIEDLTVSMGEDAEGKPLTKRLAAAFLAGQVLGAVRRFCQTADPEISGDHFRYIDGIDKPLADGWRSYANNELVRNALLPFARKAWADLSDPNGQLPYNADCYVKLWQLSPNPVIAADYILLDEDQDTAPVMLDMLKRQDALLILVGDSAQQIYEWRGAVNAADAFPDAPRRSLTQSFRFGPAIADVANSILKEIPGITMRLKGLPSIPSKVAPLAEPRCVLCRTNAVAVGRMLASVAEGKRPHLVGGGADVVAFVKGALALQQGRATSHPELACFESWGEVQEYAKLDEGEDLKLLVKLIDSFGCQPILGALERMPREADADIVYCTAHKSKGEEWETVQLAEDFPTLSKSSPEDLKLIYVAATRARLQLDVSRCPFFTGQDSLDIVFQPVDGEAPSVLPPTPAALPAAPRRQEYSWAKARSGNGWNIRGPLGAAGQTVTVTRRDGSTSQVRLGKVLWQDEAGGVALYEKS